MPDSLPHDEALTGFISSRNIAAGLLLLVYASARHQYSEYPEALRGGGAAFPDLVGIEPGTGTGTEVDRLSALRRGRLNTLCTCQIVRGSMAKDSEIERSRATPTTRAPTLGLGE